MVLSRGSGGFDNQFNTEKGNFILERREGSFIFIFLL